MNSSEVIVLKTDIQSEHMLRMVSPLFENNSSINRWSVDLEDCDKVLRVETDSPSAIPELLNSLHLRGFKTEELSD